MEDLPRGRHRASSAQQRGGTRQSQDEQERGIDGGRHWTGGRREAEVRYLRNGRQGPESWLCTLMAETLSE